ncbi:MAG: exodeoxyribonuclease VII small subunit [Paracoccaceae bacterium]
MSEENISEISFEKAMAELEEVINKLEYGEVPLEDSIKLYERGAELKKICEAKLKEAEQKVKNITLDKDGNSLRYGSEGESS